MINRHSTRPHAVHLVRALVRSTLVATAMATATPAVAATDPCEKTLLADAVALLGKIGTHLEQRAKSERRLDAMFGEAEVVSRHGDVLLTRQGGAHYLVRPAGPHSETLVYQELDGNEITRVERVGDFVMVTAVREVKTRGEVERQPVLQIFPHSLQRRDYTLTMHLNDELVEIELPEARGRLLRAGREFVLIPYPVIGVRQSAAIGTFHADGPVTDVVLSPGLGDLPVFAVDYRFLDASAGDRLLPQKSDRRVFLSQLTPRAGGADAAPRLTSLLDVPRATRVHAAYANPDAGFPKAVTVFVQLPGKTEDTLIETWMISRIVGVTNVSSLTPPVRADLDTIALDAGKGWLPAFRFRGVQRARFGTQSREWTLVPGTPSQKENVYPLLLPDARVAFEDTKLGRRIYAADTRVDQGEVFSRALGYRYAIVGAGGGYSAPFAFDTTLPLGNISRTPPVPIENLGGKYDRKEMPFYFAEVPGARNAGTLVIAHPGDQLIWVAGLHHIQRVELHDNDVRYLFWGEQRRGDEVVPLLAMYSVDDYDKTVVFGSEVADRRVPVEQFDALKPAIKYPPAELFHKLRHLGEVDDVLASVAVSDDQQGRFYRAAPLGGWGRGRDVHARFDAAHDAIEVRFERHGGKTEHTYLVHLPEVTADLLENSFRPEVTVEDGVGDVRVWAGEMHFGNIPDTLVDGVPGAPLTWNDPPRAGTRKANMIYSNLRVIVRLPNGEVIRRFARVPGRVRDLKFSRLHDGIFATGTSVIGGMRKELTAEVRWPMSDDRRAPTVLVDKDPTPIYRDADLTLYATRGSADHPPVLWMHRRHDEVGEAVPLVRVIDEKKTPGPLEQLMELLNGPAEQKVVHNTQDLDKVTRDGDLLFVTTRANSAGGAQTYVYNFRKKQMAVIIPNYRGHVDRGPLRFYVGEADHVFPTIVAVFKRQGHVFETFFDFGRLKIATDDPASITGRGNQIVFRTTTGTRRVFDTRGKYFLGLLPEDVRVALAEVDGKLGSVWNPIIFREAPPRVYERDEFARALAAAVPLTYRARGSNHVVIVAPEGAGATSSLEDFVGRYVSGDVPAQFRPVFFRVTATDASAGTKFRGSKSDKFLALREAGLKLRSTNYRLVLILENLQRLLPDGELLYGEEGDFFDALRDVMDEGDFDVIATVTPAGLEQLMRRKPDFANRFVKTVRLDPLARGPTERAINAHLADEFGGRPPIDARQVRRVVDRVARLSVTKSLPGAAFDVIKQIVGEQKPNARGITPPVGDHAIDLEVAARSGVPAVLLDKDNVAENTRRMTDFLNERVRGVPHLVKRFVNDLFTFALATNRPDWPITRIFAAGPTGTGKSELVKAALDFLFGHHQARLLISGEDFAAPDTSGKLKKLIASHVTRFPFNVLQFDEFEKMHIDNQNVLLSLADGEITGADGRKISTSLTIIYATSNLGVADVRREIVSREYGFRNGGSDVEAVNAGLEGVYEEAMRRDVRPEVRNRFDRTFVFPFMRPDISRSIAEDYLNGLGGEGSHSVRARFAGENYDLHFDKSVLEFLAQKYVDFELGARRLAINIENEVVKTFLTDMQIEGRLRKHLPYEVRRANGDFELVPGVTFTSDTIEVPANDVAPAPRQRATRRGGD